MFRNEKGQTMAEIDLRTLAALCLVSTSFLCLLTSYIVLAWNVGYSNLNNFDPVPLPAAWTKYAIAAIAATGITFSYKLAKLRRMGDFVTPYIIAFVIWALGLTNLWSYGCKRAQFVQKDVWLIPENPWLVWFLEQWAVWLAAPGTILVGFFLWYLVYSPAVERLQPRKQERGYTTRKLVVPQFTGASSAVKHGVKKRRS